MTPGSATRKWSLAIWEDVCSPAIFSSLLSLYPAILFTGWIPWHTLDGLPYFICFGAGMVVSVIVYVARNRLDKIFGCVLSLLMAGGPFWGIVVGLAGNTILDRSPSVQHETVFLGDSSGKGPGWERFASWRAVGREETLKCLPFNYNRRCFALTKGQSVLVTTRRGAFGWEWIEKVTAR